MRENEHPRPGMPRLGADPSRKLHAPTWEPLAQTESFIWELKVQRIKSIREPDKKKAPRRARGVKGGMDMGYRVLGLPAQLTAWAAMMRRLTSCAV